MRTLGIITEYNPFHNGHAYHIEKAKEQTNATFVIAIMSGNFMQRGTPAIIDKFARAEMALSSGVDLVLELPTYFATGSAEYFAKGAISILDKLGVVTDLVFGSEGDDILTLSSIASILEEEPSHYQALLQNFIKLGHSFPTARTKALHQLFPDIPKDILTSPNNILGMEYCKALISRKSIITPSCILREGGMYHDTDLDALSFFSSATSIRKQLIKDSSLHSLEDHVPDSTMQILMREHGHTFPIETSDFSSLLQYKLWLEHLDGFSNYMDISEDLSDKIKKQLNQFTDFDSYCSVLKSKDITYSRISRMLIHILLQITKENMKEFAENDYVGYARILGIGKNAAPLLSSIKAKSNIPLISKLSNAKEQLSPTDFSLLKSDILSSQIYYSGVSQKFQTPFVNEYQRPIKIQK